MTQFIYREFGSTFDTIVFIIIMIIKLCYLFVLCMCNSTRMASAMYFRAQ